MFDTLNLTPQDRRALECELLARLALYWKPAPLSTVFAPFDVPRWAVEAADRLLAAGALRADGGLLVVVDPTSAPIRRAA